MNDYDAMASQTDRQTCGRCGDEADDLTYCERQNETLCGECIQAGWEDIVATERGY